MAFYNTSPEGDVNSGDISPAPLPSISWPTFLPEDFSFMEPSIREWASEYWYSDCMAPKWDWLFPRDIGTIRLCTRRVDSRVGWDRLWSWLLGDDDV